MSNTDKELAEWLDIYGDKLIPIQEAVNRTRDRKETNSEKTEGWFKYRYTDRITPNRVTRLRMRKLYMWIDQYTHGKFYLTPTIIAFEDEKDYFVFCMWYKNNANI